VAVSLNLLGMPFERDTRSVFADADEMRRINPLGRIPSLVLDGGEVLIDSVAILDHLDELAGPARALLPARGEERRRALRIVALAAGAVDKAGAQTYERSLRPPEKVHQPWIDRCRVQMEAALAALESEAAASGSGSTWFLGRGPLQPDITTGCMIGYLRLHMGSLLPAGIFSEARYPALTRLSAELESLPAFRAARISEDEKMPGAPAG
jgi:glutathione S-transferase